MTTRSTGAAARSTAEEAGAEQRAACPPRIPLIEPDFRGHEAANLERCIGDGWVSSAGPFVAKFEHSVAQLAERQHAVATVSGSAALHLALSALGIGPGDKVIVPDWTFAATANAVRHAGADLLLVDIDPETLTLDPALVAQVLAEERIAAVIAVDVLGQVADMSRLQPLCRDAGAPLIEDAAGAIGAGRDGRPAGSFGFAATFSFNGNKVVTAGGGGMIVTDDNAFADRARHLSTQARVGSDYEHDAIGFNYRMTNLSAAVGLAQLERLADMVSRRLEIAARYDEAARSHPGLDPLPTAAKATRNGWLHPVLTASPAATASLAAHLDEIGIEARPFWRALSGQVPYADSQQRLTGVAASISGRVLSLPSGSAMTEQQVARVIDAIASWQPIAE